MKRFLVAALLLAPATASAQSLFATHGLGTPIPGVDARARGIGVNGVGLIGLSTTLLNPAEQGGTVRRGVSATLQPWGGSADINGESDRVGGTRFPLFQVLYPYRRTTFSIGYAGVLDQSWSIVADGQTTLGNETVATRDVVKSLGGINELRIGSAYYVNTSLSIGAALGVHTGGVDRTVSRSFPDTATSLLGFTTRERWTYTGPLASLGVRWDPRPATRIGASVTWSGELKAKPKEGTTTEFAYDMPIRFAAGASGRVSTNLMLAASATLSSFGSGNYAAPGMTGTTVAEKALDFGGGLEWEGMRKGDRIYPLRLGARYSKLPFHNQNESAPKEWAASAGLGLRLVQDDYGPLAVGDIGFERGKRDGWTSTVVADGLSETFWRFTATISLFGR